MTQRLIISVGIIMMILAAGCGREEKAPLPENVLRLTNGSHKDWKVERVTYLMLNVTSQIPACQKDEIYRFYSDGKGEILSGNVPCKTPEPAVQTTGAWHFTGEGETLIIRWKEEKNWEVTVNELTNDKLVVTGPVFDNFVVTATFRVEK